MIAMPAAVTGTVVVVLQSVLVRKRKNNCHYYRIEKNKIEEQKITILNEIYSILLILTI
jgi:hypothetical protein